MANNIYTTNEISLDGFCGASDGAVAAIDSANSAASDDLAQTSASNATSEILSNLHRYLRLFYPAGNQTALVILDELEAEFSDFSAADLARINDDILGLCAGTEQVGFVRANELKMAGGEICFNALRCAGKYLLDKSNSHQINVILNDKSYECSVKSPDFIQDKDLCKRYQNKQLISLRVPLEYEFFKLDDGSFVCDLKDIVHVIVDISALPSSLRAAIPQTSASNDASDGAAQTSASNKNSATNEISLVGANIAGSTDTTDDAIQSALKSHAYEYLRALGLLERKAAGVMYLDGTSMHPVVWVRDIKTLFYESACGSGSFASFVYFCEVLGRDFVALRQPSGEYLFAQNLGKYALLSSPVKELFLRHKTDPNHPANEIRSTNEIFTANQNHPKNEISLVGKSVAITANQNHPTNEIYPNKREYCAQPTAQPTQPNIQSNTTQNTPQGAK